MTNYFDLNKEFFIVDSENINTLKTALYGYSIQENGIIENENLTPESALEIDGRGAYVYIEKRDNTITIKQDVLGSYGLYLFQKDDYFAISNSFFYLLNHIRSKYNVTLNKDFVYQFLAMNFCSLAWSETLVNEVEMLPRDTVVQIDIHNKSIKLDTFDWQDKTIPLDSPEGVAITDAWFKRWTKLFREIKRRTNNISVDLTGGMDS